MRGFIESARNALQAPAGRPHPGGVRSALSRFRAQQIKPCCRRERRGSTSVCPYHVRGTRAKGKTYDKPMCNGERKPKPYGY